MSLRRRPCLYTASPLVAAYRSLLIALMLMLSLWGQFVRAENTEARVLFINSYHRGYSWSDGIEDGLRARFAESGRKVELSYEYLDSRRFNYADQIEFMAEGMARKYARYRHDLIIVSDNAAFDFAIKYRARLFPDTPIVFCGYNNFRPEALRGLSNITGVNEEIAIDDVVNMALKVHPRTRTLAFVISTADASSRRISEVAEQTVIPKLRESHEVAVLKDVSLEALRRRLAQLPGDTLLFLSGQLSDQGAGRALTPAENGTLITTASPFPAYTFWDFHLGSGAIGGHIITGPDQGRAATELALRILDGTPADSIPVIMKTPAQDLFDYRIMERFGVSTSDLPSRAQIINRPFSFWNAYRWQIFATLGLLVTQTALIGLLLHLSRARRQSMIELDKERTQLETRVSERTRELSLANAQLEKLSLTDALTGLSNRRHLDLVLEAEFARLRRSGTPLSLILSDIDHFKRFNDTYGHVAGDECLRRIGALLNSRANRAPDLAARYGGEEFVIVLPETDATGAKRLVERIQAGVFELSIPHASSDASDRVTLSLGVVTLIPAKDTEVSAAIRLADALLYQAKTEGRNRAVFLDKSLPSP